MTNSPNWIRQALTELRKLDRSAQRTHLQGVLDGIRVEERAALRHEIEARRSRVQQELRILQGRAQPDAVRKAAQKEAMIARYNWLLQVMDQYKLSPEAEDSTLTKS